MTDMLRDLQARWSPTGWRHPSDFHPRFGVDLMEHCHLFPIPHGHLAVHVHTERLVAFLETTSGEIFERVGVLAEIQSGFLSGSECHCGDEAIDWYDVVESHFTTRWVLKIQDFKKSLDINKLRDPSNMKSKFL